VIRLLEILRENHCQSPPRYEKLLGDLEGAFSRRINIQHRLVYQIFEEENIVKVIRMWTNYEWAAAVRCHGRPRALAVARVRRPIAGGQ
jgi:toxin YoeB